MARPATDELRRLIRDLDGLPADVRRELRPAMRKAGEHAQTRARINAVWSSRIPPAIHVSTSFNTRRPGVSLVVDRRRAPHGRAYENLGQRGVFRHPVPNVGRWVAQRARPFLFPAARAEMERIDADIGAAVDAAARKHGFK